jgi:hypothetical protein
MLYHPPGVVGKEGIFMSQGRKYLFAVRGITRDDIRIALSDDRRIPHWPNNLTDGQMQAIADRMRKYLEGSEAYWNALRDAICNVVPQTSKGAL